MATETHTDLLRADFGRSIAAGNGGGIAEIRGGTFPSTPSEVFAFICFSYPIV
jgi:hypothetical protein